MGFFAAASAALLAMSGCSAGGGGGSKLPEPTASTPSAVQAGPQLGYAWLAKDQTLRPILGVPGSSVTGASVVPAGTYLNGASSSAAAVALLIGTDQQVYRMNLPTGTPSRINLAAGAGARILFSPSGVAALVYVPGSLAASVVTGLSSTPQTRPIPVAAPLLDMAVSDQGTVVALEKAAGGGTLEFVSSGASQHSLGTLDGDGGLAFAGAGDDLLAADSVANTLTLIRNVSTAPSPSRLPTSNLLKAPVAVGVSHNGRWAVVANGREASVVQVDLTGATGPQRIACPSRPTVVEQLSGNGVFRFTEIGGTPTWMADITLSKPAMLFIPAAS
jgi:hypothetical protein